MEQVRFEDKVKVRKRKEQREQSGTSEGKPWKETRSHWLRRLLKEQGAGHTSEDLGQAVANLVQSRNLSGKPNCFLLHIHHTLPAHRWGLSTTLSSSLGVPVSPGFSTALVRHCLATVSEDPTEQALNHITLFITSGAKCIPERLPITPLYVEYFATMLTEPGGKPTEGI